MTIDDAIVYLRQIREDYAGKLSQGTGSGRGDWIPVTKRGYYTDRIAALDTAVVMLLDLAGK